MATPKNPQGKTAGWFNQMTSLLTRVKVKSVMNAPVWVYGFVLLAMIALGVSSAPLFMKIAITCMAVVALGFVITAYFVLGLRNPRLLMTEDTQIRMMRMEQQGRDTILLPQATPPISNPALGHDPISSSPQDDNGSKAPDLIINIDPPAPTPTPEGQEDTL